MPNPILEALLQKLAERNTTIQPGVNTSFSQPSQSNPYGATFSPAMPNPALNFMANRQNPVDLGRIDVVKPPPTQTPQQMPQQQTAPQQMSTARQQGTSPVMEFLRQLGIPLATTAVGLANENMLPGAAGFQTGYVKQLFDNKDRELKKEKLSFEKLNAEEKQEKEKWDDAYRTALELSKTGALGDAQGITPVQLDTLAGEIYKVRYGGNTKDIAKKVEDKFIGSNNKKNGKMMVDAQGNKAIVYPDGSYEEAP